MKQSEILTHLDSLAQESPLIIFQSIITVSSCAAAEIRRLQRQLDDLLEPMPVTITERMHVVDPNYRDAKHSNPLDLRATTTS